MHRREALVLGALPPSVPAPALLGVVDDGDWVALVIEWVDGAIPLAPLGTEEIDAVLDVVCQLADSGAGAYPPGLERAESAITAGLHGHWRKLIDRPLAGLDDWSARHLARLAALEERWGAAVRGDHLVHGDLRTDNVLLTDAGAVVIDWPAAVVGAPWIDLVGLLPALRLDGGPPPADVFADHPVGRTADPDAVNVFLAAITGYFTRQSLLPPPPGLPTVRAFQAAQGEIARSWLAHRLEWS
jgi:aminoglycoside phosphotransferase (APT) family kinase protein